MVAIVEAAILRKVNAFVGHAALVHAEFLGDKLGRLLMEHSPVVRQSHMDIRAEIEKRRHKRSGYIRHATGLCAHLSGKVAHAFRQIRNLRGDYQDTRLLAPSFPLYGTRRHMHLLDITAPSRTERKTPEALQDLESASRENHARERISPPRRR